MARMVVLLSLATDMAMGPYAGKETGESALLRELLRRLGKGDVLLGDLYSCSYFMIALLQELHIHCVVRLHQAREANFRRGRRLGAGDHVVVWPKPAQPEWMDDATYERMPQSIEVREVYVQAHQPGFRVESLVAVTTLTDAAEYTKDDIAELYHRRGLAELDIRAMKVTLGMDVLRCQSAEMVRREIWTCLLAYNLIRQTMLEAALKSERSPRELSFTAALQKIAAAWAVLSARDDTLRVQLIDVQLCDIAANIIGDTAWGGPPSRLTKDIDLLARMDNAVEAVVALMRAVCSKTVGVSVKGTRRGVSPAWWSCREGLPPRAGVA